MSKKYYIANLGFLDSGEGNDLASEYEMFNSGRED